MAAKNGKTTKNARQWTGIELELFPEVLADPENNFAIFFGEIGTKKSENNKVFEYIKILLRWKWITEFSNRIMLT